MLGIDIYVIGPLDVCLGLFRLITVVCSGASGNLPRVIVENVFSLSIHVLVCVMTVTHACTFAWDNLCALFTPH